MFNKKSIVGLVFANLVVIAPFIGSILILPYLEQKNAATLSYSLIASTIKVAIGGSLLASVLVAIPTLYQLSKLSPTKASSYVIRAQIWLLGWSGIAGLLLGVRNPLELKVIPFIASFAYTAFCLPVFIATLTYWYVTVRKGSSNGTLASIVMLLLLWTILCLNYSYFVYIDSD